MNTTRDERPDDDDRTEGERTGDCARGAELTCENAGALVPVYLDGELTEAQAAPLRAHLFACPACREVAKGAKNLKRWFSEAARPAVEVPPGFAARVARRAFAGDPGLFVPAPAAERSPQLTFLLQLTAVAAALLLVFAIAIQSRSLPGGDGIQADDPPPWMGRSEETLTLPFRGRVAPDRAPGEARESGTRADQGEDDPTTRPGNGR